VQQAVTHALGHVDAVRKDTRRLQRKTGCCLPGAWEKASYSCCEVAEELVPSHP
jgi:hypothetical protein